MPSHTEQGILISPNVFPAFSVFLLPRIKSSKLEILSILIASLVKFGISFSSKTQFNVCGLLENKQQDSLSLRLIKRQLLEIDLRKCVHAINFCETWWV